MCHIIFSSAKPPGGALPPPPSNLPCLRMACSYALSDCRCLRLHHPRKTIADVRLIHPQKLSRYLDPERIRMLDQHVYIECKYRLSENGNNGKITLIKWEKTEGI
jgi:hypothetical protein